MTNKENVNRSLTKKQALSDFRETYLPIIKDRYEQDRSEGWNNYVDFLCEDGLISQSQRDNWTNPF